MRILRHKSRICGYCTVLVVLALGACSIWYKVTCSGEESVAILNRLCELYDKGKAVGNWCHSLCISKTVTFVRCLNRRSGKKVFLMRHKHGPNIIFKSEKAISEDYENLSTQYPPSLDTFISMVKQSIKLNHKIDLEGGTAAIFTQIWSMDASIFSNSSYMLTAMNNLWQLLQQDEYLMSVLLQPKTRLFPKIYGTCGHFYANEYAPSGIYLDSHIALPKVSYFPEDWIPRAELALKILHFVEDLQTKLSEPVYMCDCKGENLGIGADGIIKLIDSDMALYESKLTNEIENTPNCSKDTDCDFFHCQGSCNLVTKHCRKKILNNNLQMVCANIFVSQVRNAYKGLLQAPPPHLLDVLAGTLDNCVNPTRDRYTDRRGKPGTDIFIKLKRILQQSL